MRGTVILSEAKRAMHVFSSFVLARSSHDAQGFGGLRGALKL